MQGNGQSFRFFRAVPPPDAKGKLWREQSGTFVRLLRPAALPLPSLLEPARRALAALLPPLPGVCPAVAVSFAELELPSAGLRLPTW
jgi:hypothetical protein